MASHRAIPRRKNTSGCCTNCNYVPNTMKAVFNRAG
jgi:hypothetical protein